METFGHRLSRLRGSRSQKEIAEALKMPPTTLSSLEAQKAFRGATRCESFLTFSGCRLLIFTPSPTLR